MTKHKTSSSSTGMPSDRPRKPTAEQLELIEKLRAAILESSEFADPAALFFDLAETEGFHDLSHHEVTEDFPAPRHMQMPAQRPGFRLVRFADTDLFHGSAPFNPFRHVCFWLQNSERGLAIITTSDDWTTFVRITLQKPNPSGKEQKEPARETSPTDGTRSNS
jgi:hypothetical protein